jgi:hypothetical protein
MLRCAHCGGVLIAERHKGKYTYYRCSNKDGNCPTSPTRYIREATIEARFTEILSRLRFDQDVLDWIVSTLRSGHAEEKKIRDETLARLRAHQDRLQHRLDIPYDDRVEGRLSVEEYDQRRETTDQEHALVTAQIATLKQPIARTSKADAPFLNSRKARTPATLRSPRRRSASCSVLCC